MTHKHTRHHKKREFPSWAQGQPLRTEPGHYTQSPRFRQVLRLQDKLVELVEAAKAEGRPVVNPLDVAILPGPDVPWW